MFQEKNAVAKPLNHAEVMGDYHNRATFVVEGHHPLERLFLERGISYRKDFIDQQNVGVTFGRDGEPKPGQHTAGILLDRGVDEFFQFSEGNNIIVAKSHLAAGKPEENAVYHDVFATSQLGVKACAQFNQGRNPAGDLHPPGGGFVGPGHDLEQRTLTGAVATDDSRRFATVDRKRDVAERIEIFVGVAPAEHANEVFSHGVRPVVDDPKALADVLELDGSFVGHDCETTSRVENKGILVSAENTKANDESKRPTSQ